jgi:hypothetical protein
VRRLPAAACGAGCASGPGRHAPPDSQTAGATPGCDFVLARPMSNERERLARDISGLKESITSVWVDIISKPMAAAERQELCKSIGLLVEQLDDLQSRLDQLPKSKT